MPAPRSPRPRARRAVRPRMVTFALLPALVVTLLAGVGGWVLRDEWAGVSALLGGLLSIAIFLAGLVGIIGVLAGPAYASMAGAFALLGLQLVVGFVVLYLLSRVDWVQMLPLAVGFLAAGMAFQVGVIAGYAGSRQLVFGDAESDPTPGEVR